MPTLSSQYAYITLDDGTRVDPVSVDLKLSETWSPYCQATVVIPQGAIALTDIDPRQADRLRLTMQQDFGDLLYVNELTTDYTPVTVSSITAAYTPVDIAAITRTYTKPWNIFSAGLPLSTVTTAYTPVTPLKLTNAGFSDLWRMSDFLNAGETWNPAPSTIFDGSLHVREIVEDYIGQTISISLASDEGLALDKAGTGITAAGTYTTIRSAITALLGNVGLGDEPAVTLAAGADSTFTDAFVVSVPRDYSKTLWDIMETLTQSVGFTLWCDETRTWHLEPTTITSGSLSSV